MLGAPDEFVLPLVNLRLEWYKACVAVGAGKWEDMENDRKPTSSHAGIEEKRNMDATGHKTRAMFDRYNIGKEEHLSAGRALEDFHKKRKSGNE